VSDPKESRESKQPASPAGDEQAKAAIAQRMSKVRNKVLVLSGKGGVGKSTVAVNLAVALANKGNRVGLVDIDIHGPSVPKMLHIEGVAPKTRGDIIEPVSIGPNLSAISIGLFLKSDSQSVIWRGPLKYSMIMQFLKDVEWGDLDYLVVDSPPGTGDEPLSICQLLPDVNGAVVVTTPQEISVTDVRKCLSFCKALSIPVLGIVENMAGFACPHCGEKIYPFGAGGGEKLAKESDTPFLGSMPMVQGMVEACDAGEPFVQKFPDNEVALAIGAIADKISGVCDNKK